MKDYAEFLRALAERVFTSRLSTGGRLTDAGDFRQWLLESAEKAEQAQTIEQFFAQL